MDIQKFVFFISLAETLNYTETAEQAYTTQGNVSKQIIALEKELGTELFDRSRRNIKLTNSGRTALPYAVNLVNTYEELKQTLAYLEDFHKLQLTLHGIPTMSSYQVLSLIGEFHKQHPQIFIMVEEEESDSLLKTLDQEICDISFARTFAVDLKNYERIVVSQDHFVAVLPANHRLADHSVIRLEELKNETFLQLGKSTQLYDVVIGMCLSAGFTPHIGYHGQRIDLIQNSIADGMGVSLMMEKTVDKFHDYKIATVPIDVKKYSEVSFIRKKKKQHSAAMNLFWAFLRSKIEPLSNAT